MVENTLEGFYGDGELGKEKPKEKKTDRRRVPMDLTDVTNEFQQKILDRAKEKGISKKITLFEA